MASEIVLNSVTAFDVKVGARVERIQPPAKNGTIVAILDLNLLLVQFPNSSKPEPTLLSNIQAVQPEIDEPVTQYDLLGIPQEDWDEANRRYKIIEPLIRPDEPRTRAMVTARAMEYNLDTATVYRWLKDYLKTEQLSALLPKTKRTDKGKSRLTPEVEAIIQDVIETVYLTKLRPSIKSACEEVIRRCRNGGIKPPHHNTIRQRIKAISAEKLTRKRYGDNAALKYELNEGGYPETTRPLEVVQIDHVRLDIELVDETQCRNMYRSSCVHERQMAG
ncbi:MAG: hypothetical protein ACRCYY_10740 [Trueperaceae bacterium]